MVKQRWELKIGSAVMATDDDYGRLQQLILDPYQERVIGLLVRKHGLVPAHFVIVPIEQVAEVTEREVQLKISRKQIDTLPEYLPDSRLDVEGRTYEVDDESFAVRGTQGFMIGRSPTARRPGMLESQIAQPERERIALQLRAGHKVFCQDGHTGKISMALLDPSGQVKGFIMHSGHLPGRNLIVPVAWVQEVDRENVHLSVEKSALDNLPEYSPDYALAEELDKVLWDDDILRESDYNQIDVTVRDGIVRLRGHVVTEMNKTRAEDAARLVQGVLGIENHLVVDEDLLISVSHALGRDERTHLKQVYVGAQNGVITLSGQVDSTAIREAAEEVAASVPEVRGIVNYIQAPDVTVDPEEQKVLEPPIGREIFATDMPLGQVERVIINPHNRRVTAFVAHGKFPDLRHADEYRFPYEIPKQERRVVVPIQALHYETDSSVLLDVNTIEAARYRDFDSSDFESPPEGWQPPYPYHRDDVLFVRESLNEPKSQNPSKGPG